MIPQPGKTLTDIAVRIVTHLMPDVQSAYGQADAGLISALLLTMAQDYERAVFNRMTDIDEIKDLCADFSHRSERDTSDAPDQDVLREFLAAEPASWLLADVTALHAQGFDLLIELHAWAETHDDILDQQIWRFLRRHSERNKFEIPGP